MIFSKPKGEKMSKIKLVVLDVDFTILNWVEWWYHCHSALFEKLHEVTGIERGVLYAEAREVFAQHGSLEHPFLIQSLRSVREYYFGSGLDVFCEKCLRPVTKYAKEKGNPYLTPFSGVIDTLEKIKARGIPIAVLTDAPRYVGLWRLSKMGVLPYLDGVWGLPDPLLPICEATEKTLVLPETLHKNLKKDLCKFKGHTAEISAQYEKPDPRGLQSVLVHFGLIYEPESVVFVGDNPGKDIKSGQSVGVLPVWAKYGIDARDEFRKDTEKFSFYQKFTNQSNERKNSCTEKPSPDKKPDYPISEFSEILRFLS